jgi:hypothetical protein
VTDERDEPAAIPPVGHGTARGAADGDAGREES